MHNLRHLKDFLVLGVGLGVSFLAFVLAAFNPTTQFFCLLAGVVYYILWGIFHHYLEKRLSWNVALEYVLIGGMVTFLFYLLLIAL